MADYKALRRSRRDRVLGGVCGGLADFFDLSPTGVRVVYLLGSVLSVAFPGIIVYLILWLLIPDEDSL